MRAGVVVLSEPVIDDDLGLLGRREPLRIENLPPQCPIEPLVVSVLPRRSRVNADRLDANASKPALHRFCCELGAVIGSDILWGTVAQQKRIERFENVVGSHPGAHRHRQRLPRELIENRQHLIGPPVAELVVYEVDGPDMVRMRGPQADDRAVLVIEPLALFVALRKLQPFLAPESLDLLVIDPPTFDVKQLGDLAIAISTVLLRQPDNCQTQRIVISGGWSILQGAPREADHPARPSLRRRELLACMNGGLTELRCGQALGFR